MGLQTPWKSFGSIDSDREYLALLSYLPLKRHRTIPKFFRYTFAIQRQLLDAKGLMGYALEAGLWSKKFWTLSVWEDAESLMEFVAHLPHSDVMNRLAPYMSQTRFTQWKMKGSEIPPNWGEAKERMAHEEARQ